MYFIENSMILTSAVLSQYTRLTERRVTTYYDKSWALEEEEGAMI